MNKDTFSAKWQDIANDGSLNTFAHLNNLCSDKLILSQNDALVIPNNTFFSNNFSDYNLFSECSKNVIYVFNEGGIKTQLYSDEKEKRQLILKSTDIVLPIILFLGSNVVNLGLNILANMIYDKWVKNNVAKIPKLKAEYLEIDNNGTIVRWRKIEGSANEVQKMLIDESQNLRKTYKFNKTSNNCKEESWWIAHCDKMAKEAIIEANKLIRESSDATAENERDNCEELLRKSLIKIREAALWKPDFEWYKIYLHQVGHKIHDIFGCKLDYREEKYWVTCPVLLSHSKGGFSIGGSGKAICSICGKDIFDCDHIKGEIYNNVAARHFDNICNICGAHECEHIDGNIYNKVNAFAIILEVNLDHVSLVENPANPLCVVYKYSLTKADIMKMLPKDEIDHFIYGKSMVPCHHCLICNETNG